MLSLVDFHIFARNVCLLVGADVGVRSGVVGVRGDVFGFPLGLLYARHKMEPRLLDFRLFRTALVG